MITDTTGMNHLKIGGTYSDRWALEVRHLDWRLMPFLCAVIILFSIKATLSFKKQHAGDN
jgi:hypothetical protein